MTAAGARTPADVARATFEAVIEKDPDVGGTFVGGAFLGFRPTGRRVVLRGVDVMEIANGLIQHNTIYYDGASFARQIGMLPAQGSRVDRSVIGAFNLSTRLRRRR
jgi:hypothetical protein